MKRFLSVSGLVAAALLAFGAPGAQAQAAGAGPRFGYINSQKILAEAPGSAEAQQTLQRESTQYRTQVDSLEKDLQKLQDDFNRQQATLSAAVKQQRQTELQQKFAAYQQRVGQLQQTAQQREAQLVDPIMKRIRDTIEALRKEGGYSMIFDAASSGMVAADSTLDLTDRVLARLRGTR